MSKLIENMPNWCITDKHPAFYDTESATAIEQTAKLYGAMQNLIDTFNNNTQEQDGKIAEAIKYMKETIIETSTKIINENIANGKIKIKLLYNKETEELIFKNELEG